jgi:hypothetical protein
MAGSRQTLSFGRQQQLISEALSFHGTVYGKPAVSEHGQSMASGKPAF